jgi:signal transduction histidine kinase/CheY-like chemotaxis protein
MRTAQAIIALLVFVLLISWISMRATNSDAERFDRILAELDRFAGTDAALHRDVFAARSGLLRNYDPIVAEINGLYDTLDRLGPSDPAFAPVIDKLAHAVARQEALVEQFKSNNALLQNSLAYFALMSGQLGKADRTTSLAQDVSTLATAMLRLTLDTAPAISDEVKERLDQLAREPIAPADVEAVHGLLAHGRMLHDLLPATDRLLKDLSTAPENSARDELLHAVLAEQASSRATARLFRASLYFTALLLVGLLVHFALLLRERALSLRRRAALEHVLTRLSMQLANAQPQDLPSQVKQALAEMSTCMGTDRAYLLLLGPTPEQHVWSRPETAFPPGWPAQAPLLAARCQQATPRVIHVRNASRLPRPDDRKALASFSIKGWACACSEDANGRQAMLGFDAVRRPSRVGAGELGLLPVALDMIVSAVRRQSIELDRARLETHLQQARRMETVGALASGIAHNFNNIIAAILGYVEMVEAQVAADQGALRKLLEIRRAGERARQLVEQILAFGRRRERRRRTVSLKTLIGEAQSLLTASLPQTIDLVINEIPPAAAVSAEPAQLQQVIFNLCINAAQAMDGAGRIEIDTLVVEIMQTRSLSHDDLAPGRYARIAVSDFGRGMDDMTLERLFEPFFTTRPDGNGLGLATAAEIVREYGGTINVESTPGLGSRFEIWLPYITSNTSDDRLDAALPLGNGESLLLVDDHREELLGAEEILAALGYEPAGFARAEDALKSCRAAPDRFDAFVIAHLAPAKAAVELAGRLHEIAPKIPIVLAAASVHDISARSLVMAGISEIVARPLVAAEIAAALTRCLTIPLRSVAER